MSNKTVDGVTEGREDGPLGPPASVAVAGAVAPRTITSVLVANRGEIARRVYATCRARGIETVAVYSDADAHAPFVREADRAVRLPGVTPADTYLRPELLLNAARRTGADAIHPGYGFLSENADFARAVADAGLIWIGPSPEAIDSMGSKIESKELMKSAGVPVLERLAPEAITADQLPVLVKASSGGGGRGMRVVNRLEDLAETVESAFREAASAFGDPTVFCERYLPTGHHVEVQVFGDEHGTVWAVGERECSLQRRHQKVVEEAPSPLVERHGAAMRDPLFTAARAAAARVGYTGAGTVEFLAADNGEFFFLEMNTRLQVEHPVTESTLGVDLVGLQLDIASGLPLSGPEPAGTGYAIEVRLYAEDPADGWAPQSGPVDEFSLPGVAAEFCVPTTGTSVPAVRLDAGVAAGEEISTFYDPMIAKVIGVGPTRAGAARVLAQSLADTRWRGPRINRDLLVAVLREPDFLSGDTDTTYFDAHPDVFAPLADDAAAYLGAVAATVATASAVKSGSPVAPDGTVVTGAPLSAEAAVAVGIARANPRPGVGGWRLFPNRYRTRTLLLGDAEVAVAYRENRGVVELAPGQAVEDVQVVGVSGTGTAGGGGVGSKTSADSNGVVVRLLVDGVDRFLPVEFHADAIEVSLGGRVGTLVYTQVPVFAEPVEELAPGSLVAPMPGTVIRVAVEEGAYVERGTPLLWVEAMKMEHKIVADAAGVLADLRVSAGDQVGAGTLLAVVDTGEGAGGESGDGVGSVPTGASAGASGAAGKE